MRSNKLGCVIAASFSLACGSSPNKQSDSVAATAVASAPATPASRVSVACPSTGLWAVCSLEKRMKSAGLVARVEANDTLPRRGFTTTPIVYKIGRNSKLEVFLYPDEKNLKRDVAKLDTLRGVPLGAPPDSAAPPVWIRSANLAALLFTRDAREADRVSLAITAGPPQPLR